MSHATGVGYGVVEAVDDATFVGTIDGLASTITVRVLVLVLPQVSVVTCAARRGRQQNPDEDLSLEKISEPGEFNNVLRR